MSLKYKITKKKLAKFLLKIKKGLNEVRYVVEFNKIKQAKYDCIVLCHDDHRQIYRNNQKYSPLTDSIIDELKFQGKSVVSYNLPYSKLTGAISYENPQSINGEYSRARMMQFIFKILFYFSKNKNLERWWILKFWIKIIRRHQSSKVICVQPSEDLCQAGKLISVEIIDIQHGLIDYNKYYDSRNQTLYRENGIPDTVYCWDQESKKRIEKCWCGTNAVLYGHPFISKIRKDGSGFIDSDGEEKLRSLKKSPSILITLQYTDNSLGSIFIPRFIMNLIYKCTAQGIVIGLKIHPLQVRYMGLSGIERNLNAIFPNQLNKTIFNVSSMPLVIILNNVNFHITEYSASVVEASILGVNSGVWCEAEKVEEYFLPYIESGSISIMQKDEDMILNVINREISKYA